MLPRRVFRCLVKTSLNLSLVCLYVSSCLPPYWKIMKKFKENLACWPKNFWNILIQDGLLWLQLYFELMSSLMVLSTTSLLMSLINSFPFCIIKHTKRSLIKWNVKIVWPKFILLEHLLICPTDLLCCS